MLNINHIHILESKPFVEILEYSLPRQFIIAEMHGLYRVKISNLLQFWQMLHKAQSEAEQMKGIK